MAQVTPNAYDLRLVRFLVVDRDRFMRQIIRQVLRAFNVRLVREVDNSADALELLKNNDQDIIILDYNLLPLNGIELVKMIRTAPDVTNHFSGIIMLTAYTEVDIVCLARDSGIDEFVSKPISAFSLYSRVIAVIENRRSYVQCSTYFGPDRRRHVGGLKYRGQLRRAGEGLAPNCKPVPLVLKNWTGTAGTPD